MGSCLSRPTRPKIRVLVPSSAPPSPPAKTALQERISLNSATLGAILQRMGHHPREEQCHGDSRRPPEKGQLSPPDSPPASLPCRETIPQRPRIDRDKPLPRWPLTALQTPTKQMEDQDSDLVNSHRKQAPATRLRLGSGSRVPSIILRRLERDAFVQSRS